MRKQNVQFITLLGILILVTVTYALVRYGYIPNIFDQTSGSLQPNDEAIFLLSDTENLTHTFWRIGKDGKEVKPFYEHEGKELINDFLISPDRERVAFLSNAGTAINIINFANSTNVFVPYGNASDRNSPQVTNLAWLNDREIIYTAYENFLDPESQRFFKIDVDNDGNFSSEYLNCPLPSEYQENKTIDVEGSGKILYYVSGSNFISCDFTKDMSEPAVNVLLDLTIHPWIVDWMRSNDALIVVEGLVFEEPLQKKAHNVIVYDIQSKDKRLYDLENEYYQYEYENDILYFVDGEGSCVHSLNLHTGDKSAIFCNNQHTSYLALGDTIYYSQTVLENGSAISLYTYNLKLSETKGLISNVPSTSSNFPFILLK